VVADKVAYALSKGLGVIFCIGELLEQREAGQTLEVNARQLQVRPPHARARGFWVWC
jgi:triosephosphate isomerase